MIYFIYNLIIDPLKILPSIYKKFSKRKVVLIGHFDPDVIDTLFVGINNNKIVRTAYHLGPLFNCKLSREWFDETETYFFKQ